MPDVPVMYIMRNKESQWPPSDANLWYKSSAFAWHGASRGFSVTAAVHVIPAYV